MVQVKDLTELSLRESWAEVKEEEDWWGDLKQETLRVVKRLLEGAMEGEMVEELGAGRYRRTEVRRGHRNGYRHRSLLTELGLVERLRVPRDREGRYQPTVLPRYQRRQEKVNGLVREMFLCGVSTRKVQVVVEPLLGSEISAQTVSRITRSLDGEVQRYHRRPLEDRYQYLLLDGITLKVKGATGVKKRLVVCAYGLTPQGKRELISFRQAPSESEAQWEAFLGDLYQRGLQGQSLRLITTDGCPGLHRALDTVYPYVPRQRCWAHKLRNVAAKLPRRHQEGLPDPHPAGGPGLLPSVGDLLAGPGPQSRGLPGGGPGATAALPGLSPGPLEEGAHHQRHRAALPGGAPPDEAHELLPERRQCGPDHLRSHQSLEQRLGRTNPSENLHTILDTTGG